MVLDGRRHAFRRHDARLDWTPGRQPVIECGRNRECISFRRAKESDDADVSGRREMGWGIG